MEKDVIINNQVNIIKKPELLAPAGDLERLKFACLYGADAVYVGGPLFSLRANAINFDLDSLKEGVIFAHNLNKKVYVTINIALHNSEIDGLKEYLIGLDKIGVDAIIVSDPAIIKLARDNTKLNIHLSTQQSTLNYESAQYFKNEGVSRIVLGRETSIDDIREIREKVDIELEVFIHGAMCASLSGRCVMSNFLTARDSNRGGCSQICRWDFGLEDNNENKIEGNQKFTFCTKDLSMLRYLKELIELGVASFKIEGRMRSIYYVATVVNIYRKAIDNYFKGIFEYDKSYEYTLRRVANRDAVPQFFNHDYGKNCQYYNGREEVSNQDFLGIVLSYDPVSSLAFIEQRNYFKEGDEVEFFGPDLDVTLFQISEIYDENMEKIDIVRHPKQKVYLKIPFKVNTNDMMRIKI